MITRLVEANIPKIRRAHVIKPQITPHGSTFIQYLESWLVPHRGSDARFITKRHTPRDGIIGHK